MDGEGLVKIHIDLPNHWAIGGESMWAEPLGNDVYKIENVPFYAYGLNFKDIVRATSESNELTPEIRELVESSGHRTFRLFFKKEIKKGQQEEILDSFKTLHVSYERANGTYIALDMKPEGDYQSIFDKLEQYEKLQVLGFETCDPRIDGGFDDLPQEEERE